MDLRHTDMHSVRARTSWKLACETRDIRHSNRSRKFHMPQTPELWGNFDVDPLGFVVRRRFSDFRWLRDVLANRYVGLFVPALPEKGKHNWGLWIL